MLRRDLLLASAGAVLACPAVAAEGKVIIHVPQANLTSLDPVWTTAVVTRNAAHLQLRVGHRHRVAIRAHLASARRMKNRGSVLFAKVQNFIITLHLRAWPMFAAYQVTHRSGLRQLTRIAHRGNGGGLVLGVRKVERLH